MAILCSLVLNRSVVRTLVLITAGVCLYFAYRDYLQMMACWECFSAGIHDEKLELRQDSIAAILVAVGVLLESFDILAKKAAGFLPGQRARFHATADVCAVNGAFVVVIGLLIEMVNQVAKTIDGNHASIHLVKSALNLPLVLSALALLLSVFLSLCRKSAKPDGTAA